LSLVQKIDSIDNKTDQIIAMQKAASMGHLMATTATEYSHFIQHEFKPRMVMLEEERDKIGKFGGGCGCAIVAAATLFGFMGLSVLLSGDAGAFVGGLVMLAIAVGIICAVMARSTKQRKTIQEKMDSLTQKKTTLEKSSDDLKKAISSGF
jgi:hypothetical protein